jgi:hypothetical protein
MFIHSTREAPSRRGAARFCKNRDKGRRLGATRIAVGFSVIQLHTLLLVLLGGDKMGYVILCPPIASVFLRLYDYHYDYLAM